MTMDTRAEVAARYKATGYNCAQAVLKAFDDRIDLEEHAYLPLASGFAAGMGSMEGTCGAVVGAVMAAGAMTDGEGTPALAREILRRFKEDTGATICKDIKGKDTGAVLASCEDCVKNAVSALEEVLA